MAAGLSRLRTLYRDADWIIGSDEVAEAFGMATADELHGWIVFHQSELEEIDLLPYVEATNPNEIVKGFWLSLRQAIAIAFHVQNNAVCREIRAEALVLCEREIDGTRCALLTVAGR